MAAALLPHSKILVNFVALLQPLMPTPGQYGSVQTARFSPEPQNEDGQPSSSPGGQRHVMLIVQVEVQPWRSITVKVKSPRVFTHPVEYVMVAVPWPSVISQ